MNKYRGIPRTRIRPWYPFIIRLKTQKEANSLRVLGYNLYIQHTPRINTRYQRRATLLRVGMYFVNSQVARGSRV